MVEVYLISSIFKCDVGEGSAPPPLQFGRVTVIFACLVNCCSLLMLIVLFTQYLYVNIDTSHRFGWNLAPLLKVLIGAFQILLAGWLYTYVLFQIFIFRRTGWFCSLGPVLVQMLAIWTLYAVLGLLEMASEGPYAIRLFPELFGLKPLKRRGRGISLLFAILSIASIICYYLCIYDPSNTYKPPWTEYLG